MGKFRNVGVGLSLGLAVATLGTAAAGEPRRVRRPVLALTPAQSFSWAAGGATVQRAGPPPAEFRRAFFRVQRAMAPVCGKRCGAVVLVRDNKMTSAGQARPGRGYTTLAVNPANAVGWKLAFGHNGPLLVMAHEYAHHLDIQNRLGGVATGDEWPAELLADTIAGCALARSGVSWRKLARALRFVRSVDFDHYFDHPHGADVARALRAGHKRCLARNPPTLEELVRDTRDVWRVFRPGPLREVVRSRRR